MNPEKLRTYYGLNKHMSGIYGSDWIVLIKSKNIQNLQKLYWNMPFWVGLPWILPLRFRAIHPFATCSLVNIYLWLKYTYITRCQTCIYIIIQYIYMYVYPTIDLPDHCSMAPQIVPFDFLECLGRRRSETNQSPMAPLQKRWWGTDSWQPRRRSPHFFCLCRP